MHATGFSVEAELAIGRRDACGVRGFGARSSFPQTFACRVRGRDGERGRRAWAESDDTYSAAHRGRPTGEVENKKRRRVAGVKEHWMLKSRGGSARAERRLRAVGINTQRRYAGW